MHSHPTLGVKNAKPRLSSKPGPKIGKLSEEYLEIRNAQMRTKNLTAEMVLAERRGELIEKRLVERQAGYLLVALRQAILKVPQNLVPQADRLEGCGGGFENPAGNGGLSLERNQRPSRQGHRSALAGSVGIGWSRAWQARERACQINASESAEQPNSESTLEQPFQFFPLISLGLGQLYFRA